ncbi:thiamine biosynthesis protein ThiS [Paenibacillus pectinilyticus]|uniref:Thiamine biosynthesis protein ThiS n=1 Tax=Paenibacillus pectinilyticus TaxID=512399 RepID=A0A1C0ZU21_9BACL|nr:sulfur carrier protein ThiS [Paenibacillus pectinilyticus]OCT11577.1 thiamine biosynthesis protein ThiS [Paenibacillus pectinilyticus]
MKLHINGEQVDVPETIRTVEELLAHFDLSDKMLVVEHNAAILHKENHAGAKLAEGHQIEIVHFVGGG